MYPRLEMSMSRKKKVPTRFLPNTYRLFDENLHGVNLNKETTPLPEVYRKPEKLQHPRSPTRNNMPHPYYGRFLRDNSRFLKEPIPHMETASTKHMQSEWWPRDEDQATLHKPSYDVMTTQRSDFQKSSYLSNPQTRYSAKPCKSPVCGIVPLAPPRSRTRLPKLLQEQISFIHNYNARSTQNEPIRGKRHGAFVWTEIKTESGPAVPQGTKLFLNTTGSHSLDQAEGEKGNSGESSMTSPRRCMHASQQMFSSQSYLSKTDLGEAAKSNPSAADSEQNKSSSSQTTGRKTLVPIGEKVSSQPSVNSA
ncbi:uncharacterized protein C2orf73 [Xenopus laevis]|uniref:Uncharacterized protein C2orf73 n=3 Tax=Xenopus laevis TaxID=8355 RepID=A0A1L8G668_XENLA|nr:uncharacterized protein C2orf73 [Xenopus laevis]OCT79285.1 hypothetical protein XELAEV_18026095mg [Xenopus laevis]